MNIGIIVTSRVKSSRLLNKVVQKINNKYTIEILLDNLLKDDTYPVIMAIPESSDDDILQEISERKGVDVYRGYDDSPLHRLYYCAKEYGFDHVVRVTHDDILIDMTLLKNQIRMHTNGNHDYSYMKKCLEGCGAEVIRTRCLGEVVEKVKGRPVEFVSYYLRNKCKTFEYYPPYEYQFPYRCTIDYPEDLTLMRILFAILPPAHRGTLDIIHTLGKYPYLTQINRLPTVTVYTSCYNHEKYIVDCFDSVINQTYKDFEFIIYDDHSTDHTAEVIMDWFSVLSFEDQAKVKIIRNPTNMGLPATCNKALTMARGKQIIRVDSDDILEPQALESMVEEMKMSGVQGVVSDHMMFDESGDLGVEPATFEHAGCSMLSTWAVNEVKFRDGLEYLEGEDFFKRFKKIYKTSIISDVLWKYRQHEEQKSLKIDHPHNKE